jgi:hypothetical protein
MYGTYSVMTLVGTATETVQSLGSVGLNLAEGLNDAVSIWGLSSSPSLSSRRLCNDVSISTLCSGQSVWTDAS